MSRANLIIIVAPSGTGKSSLIKKIQQVMPNLQWSISTTTRKPRINEVNGLDYFFIDQEKFQKMLVNNEFVEWAKVHGNLYGTSRYFVERGIKENQTLLFDLDVQGTDSMLRDYKNYTKAIFIAPPSLATLEERLKNRGTEDEETIKERISNAASELQRKNDYDYLVLNDDFDQAFKDLILIIREIIMKGTP